MPRYEVWIKPQYTSIIVEADSAEEAASVGVEIIKDSISNEHVLVDEIEEGVT